MMEDEFMEIRVRLELSRTTKNTYKYDALGDAAVRTIYLQKDAVTGDSPPGRIDLILTEAG